MGSTRIPAGLGLGGFEQVRVECGAAEAAQVVRMSSAERSVDGFRSRAMQEARRLRVTRLLRGFVDIDAVAEMERLEVVSRDLHHIQEIKYGRWVAVARDVSERWRRFLIARAIGHHAPNSGNQLTCRQLFVGGDLRIEREADEFAWHLLVDEGELARVSVQRPGVAEGCEHFGVPEEMAFAFLSPR